MNILYVYNRSVLDAQKPNSPDLIGACSKKVVEDRRCGFDTDTCTSREPKPAFNANIHTFLTHSRKEFMLLFRKSC